MGKRFDSAASRTLTKAEEGSVYGVIIKALGGNKFEVYCSDAVTRVASIRGKMIKRVWIKERDIVLCSLREGSGKFCDIELKYTDAEVKALKEGNYITDALLNQDISTLNVNIDFSQL